MPKIVHTNQPGIQRDRILRLPEVEALTGLKKSTIYELAKTGRFPKQISVHRRMAGWSENAVLHWVQERINGQPAGSAPVRRESEYGLDASAMKRLSTLKITKPGWYAVGAVIEHECDETPDIASFNPASFDQEGRDYEEMVANAKVCAAAPSALEILARLSDAVSTNGWTRNDVLAVAEDANKLLEAIGL